MNNNIETIALEMLYEKQYILDEILSCTINTTFYDNQEDNYEKYINLMETRKLYFDKIKSIDKELNDVKFKNIFLNGSQNFLADVNGIKSSFSIISKKIIDIDKQNQEVINKIMAYIKSEMKDVKDYKKVSVIYNDNSDLIYNAGYYFDKTN